MTGRDIGSLPESNSIKNSRLPPALGYCHGPSPKPAAHPRFSKKMGLYFSYRPEWRGLPMQTDIESLKQRIDKLHLEHRDLDEVIAKLAGNPGQDQLQLQRLKKKKLLLKDQISHLERQLTPDIR